MENGKINRANLRAKLRKATVAPFRLVDVERATGVDSSRLSRFLNDKHKDISEQEARAIYAFLLEKAKEKAGQATGA